VFRELTVEERQLFGLPERWGVTLYLEQAALDGKGAAG
jgi:hypothetical protein